MWRASFLFDLEYEVYRTYDITHLASHTYCTDAAVEVNWAKLGCTGVRGAGALQYSSLYTRDLRVLFVL